jgi:flagellar protein FlgJ
MHNTPSIPATISQPSHLAFDPKVMEAHKNSHSPKALQAASVQFEALLLEQMLKSMRSATNVLNDDSLLNRDQEMKYQAMYDSQLALHMASSGSFGLAQHLVTQVCKHYGEEP